MKFFALSLVAVLFLAACGEDEKPQLPPAPPVQGMPQSAPVQESPPPAEKTAPAPPLPGDTTPAAPLTEEKAKEVLNPESAPDQAVPVVPAPAPVVAPTPAEEIAKLLELDIIGLYKVALNYASDDEMGLRLPRAAGIDFADQIVSYGRRIGPRILVTHKLAFNYAFHNAKGLTIPLRDAHCWADQVAHQQAGLEKLAVFQRAYEYALWDEQGLRFRRPDAYCYAKRISGLIIR